MISLHNIRSRWCRPGWAVLFAVCVLVKSFAVNVAAAHDMHDGATHSSFSSMSDLVPSDDPSDDGSESEDSLHRLLHAHQSCLQDAMAVFASDHPVWVAYPHSPPAVALAGRSTPLESRLLRPPRLS